MPYFLLYLKNKGERKFNPPKSDYKNNQIRFETMKSLYEEILEEKEKFDANVLRKKEFKEIILKQRKRRKWTRIIVLLISVPIVAILFVSYLLVIINIRNQEMGHYNDRAIINNPNYKYYPENHNDHYPQIKEVTYGKSYFQAGVWYKYFEIGENHEFKEFYFKSMKEPKNRFKFWPLGFAEWAVSAKISDSVLVAAR